MRPRYIDTHCHVNFPDFDADREEVIERTLSQDTWMINIGTSLTTSRQVVSLTEQHDKGMYAVVGVHPTHDEQIDMTELTKLAEHNKVVGIGETGLDYFRSEVDDRERQQEVFIEHIKLANKVGKPLMLHIRPSTEDTESYTDALNLLKQYAKVPGNAHFFAGSVEDAKGFLDIGYTVSFTGVITFTHDYDEVIRYVPLQSILSETDTPYVAPVPHRGKRNEPLFVQEVVKRLAEIREKPLDEVREQMVENAFRVFQLL